jgi:DNA polymerase
MSYGRVFIDFETRSFSDLKQVGEWIYSRHQSTEVICLCYKFHHPDGTRSETLEWCPIYEAAIGFSDIGMPIDLRHAIMSGYEVEAHKYSFELSIWMNVCVPRYGFCSVMPGQWRDTMAVACYYAMPAALDALCRALRIPGKDPEGARLITKYCKLHLPSSKQVIPPEDLRKFIDYCKRDVEVEEHASDILGDLPEREMENFRLDQTINMRGLYLDAAGIDAATRIVDERSEHLTARFQALTGLNPTQGAKLLVWFGERGLKLDNMKADYLEDLIEEGNVPPGPAREAMDIRLKINKASTKKLDAMSRQRDTDGRARWQTRYHGASTGRDTGGGFQPLNLVRSWEDIEPDDLVRDVMYGNGPWLDACYGDAMEAVSKAGRHWIKAEEGKRILAGDFVSIEAVMLACQAGEDWKVEAFRQEKFIYGLMGCKIHGLDPALAADKKAFKSAYPTPAKDGKTGELAFGYQGALGAWLKFDSSGRHTDERIIEICKTWRGEHPMIVKFWGGLNDAAIEAMINPGAVRTYRDIGFEVVDEWLSMILPNEKRLWYRDPELRTGMPRWHNPEAKADCADGSCRCRPQAHLTYMAQKEGQWRRVSTYGGKLAENATQAASREYLMPSVKAAEKAGYPVVLKVYDEVVAEVPNGHGSLEEFLEILKNAPGRDWAKGYPIGVDGWEGQRYRK